MIFQFCELESLARRAMYGFGYALSNLTIRNTTFVIRCTIAFLCLLILPHADNFAATLPDFSSPMFVPTKQLVQLNSKKGAIVVRDATPTLVNRVDENGLPLLDGEISGTIGLLTLSLPASQTLTSAAVPVLSPTLTNPDFEDGSINNQASSWSVCSGNYSRTLLSSNDGIADNYYALELTANSNTLSLSACQAVRLNQVEDRPVFIGTKVKGTQINSNTGSGAYLLTTFFMQDGTSKICSTLTNTGSFGWRWIGLNSSACGVDRPIKDVQVELRLDEASGTAFYDLAQLTQYTPSRAAATIQFDDSQITNWISAKPIISGPFKGSVAYSTDDQQSFPAGIEMTGLMALEDVLALRRNYRWDIPSHTVHHYALTEISLADTEAELRDSKEHY